jgi:hypothetical protein
MEEIYEYFENNKWKRFEENERLFRKLCKHNIPIHTVSDDSECWYLGYRMLNERDENFLAKSVFDPKLHRLDGPASIRKDSLGIPIEYTWYIDDIWITDFEKYFSYSKIPHIDLKSIRKYLKKHPIFLEEVMMLVRHNNWLNEKELDLLTCADMFDADIFNS